MTTSTPFARSTSLRFDEDDLSSSPDPLATSFNDENSFPRSSPIKATSPSPRKCRTAKVLQDITLSSPHKARMRSIQPSDSPAYSQTEPFLSPWKIRVTVEAQPDEAGHGRVNSTSRTTMVPLRDTSSPTKESGGRRRSNSGSRKLGSKRRTSGTPARNGRQSSEIDVGRLTDLDIRFLDDDPNIQTKLKRKPGTRKSRKASETDVVLADQDGESSIEKPGGLTEVSQSLSDNHEEDAAFAAGADSEHVPSQAGDSPKLRELDFSRISVRSRGEPRKSTKIPMAERTRDGHEKIPIAALPAARSSTAADDGKRQVPVASAVTYPTPDASVQDEMEAHGPSSDPTEEHVGFDAVLESEGFTMIDLESLPSAQHFVTSPDGSEHRQTEPSANHKTPADLEQPGLVSYPVLAPQSSLKVPSSPTVTLKANKPPPTPIPSYLAPPENGESDLSSTVPSSPPVEIAPPTFPRRSNPLARSPLRQAHTPLALAASSPKFPLPPNQPHKEEKLVVGGQIQSTPPRLARVVRAGIALQGLLSPKVKAPSVKPSQIQKIVDMGRRSASTPKERLDDLFVGFDSGARRELRAGLRFGEDLAKRQRLSSPQPSSSGQEAAPEVNEQVWQECVTAWRGENVVKHTPVRCSDPEARRTTSHDDRDTPASRDTSTTQKPATPFDANKSCGSIFFLDAEARERRWQLEREAISRQIENANMSQVVVIDSDDEGEAHAANPKDSAIQPSPVKSIFSVAEDDIWLAEAEDAQTSSRHAEEDFFPRAEQLRQRERAKEILSKPRRSLIPSPWKRGEDVDSTLMTDGDVSGMFWQQPKGKDAAGSMRRVQSTGYSGEARKGRFDVKKMISGSLPPEEPNCTTTEGAKCQGLDDSSERSTKEPCISQNEAETFEQENNLAEEENSRPDAELEDPSKIGEEYYEESFISPQPIMVPVNFNDTTDLSIQCEDRVQDNTQLESPPSSPCRPVTPRSAMKGSRASLDIVDKSASPTPRRVVFSRHSLCLDDSGMETSIQVRRGSLSPESSIASDDRHGSENGELMVESKRDRHRSTKGQKNENAPAAVPTQIASVSWFSILTGWGSKPAPPTCPAPAPKEPGQQQTQHSESNIQWEPTTTALPSVDLRALNAPSAPSPFLSHFSDPRIPPPPESMAVSGYFTDYHYKHLHILWLKAEKPTFTRPGSVRPALTRYIGQTCYGGEFEWEITRRGAEVVERWIRSFEGRDARETVKDWSDGAGRYRKIEWDEWDLCKKLFSLVAGQELRREERARKEKKEKKERKEKRAAKT